MNLYVELTRIQEKMSAKREPLMYAQQQANKLLCEALIVTSRDTAYEGTIDELVATYKKIR